MVGSTSCCWSTFWSFRLLGWPRLWCILEIHCLCWSGNERNLGPWCTIDCLSCILGSAAGCGLVATSWKLSELFDVVWISGILEGCWSDSRELSSLWSGPRLLSRSFLWAWDGQKGDWPSFGSSSWSLLIPLFSLANTVTNNRAGGLLEHNWRMLRLSHCSHWQSGKGSRLWRWIPSVMRRGASCGINFTGDLRKRSAPLHSSTTRTIWSGNACCTTSNKAPCSSTVLPTRGANCKAWSRIICLDGFESSWEELASDVFSTFPSGTLGEVVIGYPSGWETLPLRRLRFAAASENSSIEPRIMSCEIVDSSWTCKLAHMVRATRWQNMRVYSSVYSESLPWVPLFLT